MYQVGVGRALGQLPDPLQPSGEFQVCDRAGQQQSEPRPVGAGHRGGGRGGGRDGHGQADDGTHVGEQATGEDEEGAQRGFSIA